MELPNIALSIPNITNHLSHVCLQGFGKLKQYVPDLKSKSSKVETLRGAIDYIRRLKELLGEDVADLCTPVPKIELEDDDGKQRHSYNSLFFTYLEPTSICFNDI